MPAMCPDCGAERELETHEIDDGTLGVRVKVYVCPWCRRKDEASE
jgi:hypothetical protein